MHLGLWIGISAFEPEGTLLSITFVKDFSDGSGTLRHQPFGRQYGVGHMGDKSVDQMA